MTKIATTILCGLLSCWGSNARADITYTLLPVVNNDPVGDHATTLTGSITVDHTGNLTAADITSFSFVSVSTGIAFVIPGGGLWQVAGNLGLVATPTTLGFSPVAGSSTDNLEFFQPPIGESVPQVNYSPQSGGSVGWIGSACGGAVCGLIVSTEHSYSASGFIVIGSVASVPEPSTYALALAGLGIVAFARKRRNLNGALSQTLAAA